MTETLALGDLAFTVRRSTRRTTLGITLDRDGTLILSAPVDCSLDSIAETARAKLLWVYTRLAERELLRRPVRPKEFVNGEGFGYLGRSYRLLLVAGTPAEPPLRLYQGRFLLRRDAAPCGQQHMTRWYVAHGQPWITRRVALYADRIAVTPRCVAVKELGYRWGSCSPTGRLHFHWRTLALPPRIIDYVVIHELVHLAVPHHDDAFWKRVDLAMPDYAERKRWLDEQGGDYA